MSRPKSTDSFSSCMFAARVKEHPQPGPLWPTDTRPSWTPTSNPETGVAAVWDLPGTRRRRLVKKTRTPKTPNSCKHVPHREKPPQIVERRNARERRRVQAVNTAFLRLRRVVPIENSRGKRVSKVKTLHKAIEYISQLQNQLIQGGGYPVSGVGGRPHDTLNKENQRWGAEPQSHHHDSLAELLVEFDDDDF